MPTDLEFWSNAAALAALAGIAAYAVLGGADFGGGVWDLFASGPRKRDQRLAIQHAMGPVWEANHVWLVFVVVVLFTCFPRGFAALNVALFLPMHVALIGIMLRGASFVFRSHQSRAEADLSRTSAWGIVFGVASLISPLLLGTAFGAVTEGGLQMPGGQLFGVRWHWLSVYSLTTGLLALATCAYLAAVYLTNETQGELREDFRLRAIVAGTATAALAFGVLLLTRRDAPWFFDRLTRVDSLPIIAVGLACFAGSAWSVFTRRYALSRMFAVAQVVVVLIGWGVAQYPYFVYPELTLLKTSAPLATVRFLVLSIPVGMVLLLPSLWLLFAVFKSRHGRETG